MSKHKVEWYKYLWGCVTEAAIVCTKDDGTFAGFRIKGSVATSCPNCGAMVSVKMGVVLMVDDKMEWPE